MFALQFVCTARYWLFYLGLVIALTHNRFLHPGQMLHWHHYLQCMHFKHTMMLTNHAAHIILSICTGIALPDISKPVLCTSATPSQLSAAKCSCCFSYCSSGRVPIVAAVTLQWSDLKRWAVSLHSRHMILTESSLAIKPSLCLPQHHVIQ